MRPLSAVGVDAIEFNDSGDGNTANGLAALVNNTTCDDNIALGGGAGINVITANHVICIGADGNDANNACFIGQIFGTTSVIGIPVLINSNDRLGMMTS